MIIDDFMVRAALAGVGTTLAAAPLGCFVVWRRMAYFGDATAHAAILGVALSLALSLPIFAGALSLARAMAVLVTLLSGRGRGLDTVLGVLAHSALAFGLVGVSFLHGVRIDVMSFTFGDILSVSYGDLVRCGACAGHGMLAVVRPADRDVGPRSSPRRWDRPKARGVDPDRRLRHRCGCRDQGRGRAADNRAAHHSGSDRQTVLAHTRGDGRGRRPAGNRGCMGRAACVLSTGYANWSDNHLRERDLFRRVQHFFSAEARLTQV